MITLIKKFTNYSRIKELHYKCDLYSSPIEILVIPFFMIDSPMCLNLSDKDIT